MRGVGRSRLRTAHRRDAYLLHHAEDIQPKTDLTPQTAPLQFILKGSDLSESAISSAPPSTQDRIRPHRIAELANFSMAARRWPPVVPPPVSDNPRSRHTSCIRSHTELYCTFGNSRAGRSWYRALFAGGGVVLSEVGPRGRLDPLRFLQH